MLSREGRHSTCRDWNHPVCSRPRRCGQERGVAEVRELRAFGIAINSDDALLFPAFTGRVWTFWAVYGIGNRAPQGLGAI